MTNLDKVTLRKQLTDNSTKSYNVYKVIVVPHIYNQILGKDIPQ